MGGGASKEHAEKKTNEHDRDHLSKARPTDPGTPRSPHDSGTQPGAATAAFTAFLDAARLLEFLPALLAEGFDDASVLSAADDIDQVADRVGMRLGHRVKLREALRSEQLRHPGLFDIASDRDEAAGVVTQELLDATPPAQVPPRPASSAWRAFLDAVKSSGLARGKRVYLSYAYGPTPADTERSQSFLMCLASDLRACGVENVFLDIETIIGNWKAQMEKEISRADVILPVVTPHFRRRLAEGTGQLAREWSIISRALARDGNSTCLMPILLQGEMFKSTPRWMLDYVVKDFTSASKYEEAMSSLGGLHVSLLGIIPAICGVDVNNAGAYADIVSLYHRDRTAPPLPLRPAKRPPGWQVFLSQLREFLIQREDSQVGKKRVFLSYAWEEDTGKKKKGDAGTDAGTDAAAAGTKEKEIVVAGTDAGADAAADDCETDGDALQEYLGGIKRDLLACGISDVFFDIENMQGDMEETMRRGVAGSDMVIFACTPRFRQRAMADTNVKFEIDATLQNRRTVERNLHLAPVVLRGDFGRSVPRSLQGFLVRDASDPKSYVSIFAGLQNPLGIIPALFGISAKNDPEYVRMLENLMVS